MSVYQLIICMQISRWPGDLLWLAWAWRWDPQCHTISCTSVLTRVIMGQTGYPRSQNDLSGQYAPTSHRFFPSARCSPASCVSVLPLPRACLGPASPACPPCLPTAPVSLWLSLCLTPTLMGLLENLVLKSDVPGPEAIKEGFRYIETTVPQVESTCRQQQGCPWPLLPKSRDKPPLSLPSTLCSGDP